MCIRKSPGIPTEVVGLADLSLDHGEAWQPFAMPEIAGIPDTETPPLGWWRNESLSRPVGQRRSDVIA